MALRLRNPLRQPAKALYCRALALYRPARDARPKVFGIGLSRTGTKSLHQALRILGYRSDHFSTHLLTLAQGELGLDWSSVRDYDALTDVTAARFYRELDARFPGARFILTVREPQAWLRSCARHFPPLRAGHWPSGVDEVLQLRPMG
jgi:hypothetical protein